MTFPDYYAIMGLQPSASAEDIKRAYRRLARKYHPDVSSETNAEDRFKAVGEAYEVLKDAERRADYDRAREQWQRAGRARSSDWREFSGGAESIDPGRFEDLFSSLFGGIGGGGFAGQEHPGSGAMEVHLSVSLEEAFTGCRRSLRLTVPEFDADGRVHTRERVIDIAIPAGARNGEVVRVNARHLAAPLRVRVEHLRHSLFTTDGRDVLYTLEVAPWEAALGEVVPVPTLGGTVNLKLPATATRGATLRLRGRGLPAPTNSDAGDQLVAVNIVTPRASNKALEQAYRQLANAAREANWQPRSLATA